MAEARNSPPSWPERDTEDAPFVSVVMPAYNSAAYIEEALDSVFAQTFRDFEVVVVNDASTDGTSAILERYRRQGRIRVVRHQRNRGLAAARNSGIRAARGTYVSFLDSDDIWRPEKLEFHMSILRKDPEIVLLSNDGMVFRDGDRVQFPPLPEQPRLRPVSWMRLLMGSCPLSASSAIVRRDALEEVGLFDDSLRAAEDRDLWMRLTRRFGGWVASGVVHGYRRHEANMSSDPSHMERNMLMVIRRTFRRVPCTPLVRMRALGHMYLDVAVTCYDTGRHWRSVVELAKSFAFCPVPLGRIVFDVPFVRIVWLVKALLGKPAFELIWKAVRRRTDASGGSSGRRVEGIA